MAHCKQFSSKLSKDDLVRLVLDYQGKFDSMFKTAEDDICELKTKFTGLDSGLHVSTIVTTT